MATHGLLWMDARSEMRDNALFHLKKLWGFLDMPDGPVIGEMFWDNMADRLASTWWWEGVAWVPGVLSGCGWAGKKKHRMLKRPKRMPCSVSFY